MSEMKIEEIKAGDVMEDEHGLFLITKIDYENGNIHAFKNTFECTVLSIAYVMKYCYYVRSLDMEKIVSFLQGHEWWENQEKVDDKTN